MPTPDLRDRLAEANAQWYHGTAYAPYAAPGHSTRADNCARCNENVELALPAVAAWLRERAEHEHDPDCEVGRRELGGKGCAHFDARWRRDFAIALADEIGPKEASGEH